MSALEYLSISILVILGGAGYGGIMLSDILLPLYALFLLYKKKSVSQTLLLIILFFALISYIFKFNSIDYTFVSQFVKFISILIALDSIQIEKGLIDCVKGPRLNFILMIWLLPLISVIFNLRPYEGYYIDASSGIFRHSVDIAVYVICFYFVYLNIEPYIKNIKKYTVNFIVFVAALFSNSRSLILIALYFIFNVSRVKVIVAMFLSLAVAFPFVIEGVGDKATNFIVAIMALDWSYLASDSSILVRFGNLYDTLSEVRYNGLSKHEMHEIISSGDKALDNILLYKIIYYGPILGVLYFMIVTFFLYRKMKSNLPIFTVLIIYGILQDWMSNSFAILVILHAVFTVQIIKDRKCQKKPV